MEKKTTLDVTFVVDHRERDVVLFIESIFTEITPIKKQLTIGDFHVCRGEKVLACIERKTLNDFAQSFGDGRYENVNKLLDLRNRTGCQVYYIIEGPAFPSLDRKFHRIAYSHVLAAITKLMVRHGIMIIQTENQEHSAKRLHDLAIALAEEKPYRYPVGEEKEAEGEQKMIDGVPAAIVTKVEEPDHERVVKIWTALKGVSVVTAKMISGMFSVVDLVSKQIDIKKIDEIKTFNGRQIHKNARKSLVNLRVSMNDESARILSAVGGLGWDSAEHLIKEAGGFARFCSYKIGAMAIMSIPRKDGKKVKLGEARAARIIRLLNYNDSVKSEPNIHPASGETKEIRKKQLIERSKATHLKTFVKTLESKQEHEEIQQDQHIAIDPWLEAFLDSEDSCTSAESSQSSASEELTLTEME